jgi:hypothetical protein
MFEHNIHYQNFKGEKDGNKEHDKNQPVNRNPDIRVYVGGRDYRRHDRSQCKGYKNREEDIQRSRSWVFPEAFPVLRQKRKI